MTLCKTTHVFVLSDKLFLCSFKFTMRLFKLIRSKKKIGASKLEGIAFFLLSFLSIKYQIICLFCRDESLYFLCPLCRSGGEYKDVNISTSWRAYILWYTFKHLKKEGSPWFKPAALLARSVGVWPSWAWLSLRAWASRERAESVARRQLCRDIVYRVYTELIQSRERDTSQRPVAVQWPPGAWVTTTRSR